MVDDRADLAWGSPASPAALGELVTTLRRRAGLTQSDLADRSRTPRRFVNELEGGHATLALRRLFAVLDALDVQVILQERASASPHVAGSSSHAPDEADDSGGIKDLGW